jgi:hypothetical protein
MIEESYLRHLIAVTQHKNGLFREVQDSSIPAIARNIRLWSALFRVVRLQI